MEGEAFEFSAEVDRQIETFSERAYLQRLGSAKKLIEEFYPLSRLGLHFKQPGLNVRVVGFEDKGSADGHIKISGYYQREFEVQITYAGFARDEALRAELLASDGFCPGAGNIRRDKKSRKIITTMEAVDSNEHIDRIALAVFERFNAKSKMAYPVGTVLLIAFDERRIYGRTCWNNVFSVIESLGGISGGLFAEVYIFNGATSELYKAA